MSVELEVGYASTAGMVRSVRSILQGQPPIGAPPILPAPRTETATNSIPHVTKRSGSRRYALAFILATLAGMGAVCYGNKAYGPEMYKQGGMAPAAAAHAENQNYAVFDLNLNIRALRDEQLRRMTKTPDVIILGASHWQEAHADLIPGQNFFNAHIHRDYWEDPLGMVELLIRHDRLPKKLIIAVRDNQFTPVAQRKDFLWEPGIPAYRSMAKRLDLMPESYIKTLPYDRARALLSLPMLFENVTRWHNAPEHPGPSDEKHFETLDTLLPDGSIVWSNRKMNLFTADRTKAESLAFAAKRENDPPQVDPQGVLAFNTLLTFLKEKGVSVSLVKPPFNPTYYDRLQGTPYAEGLARVDSLIDKFASDHQLPVFGSFNPHSVGCTAEMYIDAEHSNEKCLKKIFDQFVALDSAKGAN